MESKVYDVKPADRLATVNEYYFSRKGKEVARLNAEGKDIISLAIGSPDMPPSKETIDVLCEQARRPDTHGYQPTVGTKELLLAFGDALNHRHSRVAITLEIIDFYLYHKIALCRHQVTDIGKRAVGHRPGEVEALES
jgi:hypothetical protein